MSKPGCGRGSSATAPTHSKRAHDATDSDGGAHPECINLRVDKGYPRSGQPLADEPLPLPDKPQDKPPCVPLPGRGHQVRGPGRHLRDDPWDPAVTY